MDTIRRWIAMLLGRPSVQIMFENGVWYAFDRVTPNWGEGQTEGAALADLRPQLVHLRDQLRKHKRLGRGYREQRSYLESVVR